MLRLNSYHHYIHIRITFVIHKILGPMLSQIKLKSSFNMYCSNYPIWCWYQDILRKVESYQGRGTHGEVFEQSAPSQCRQILWNALWFLRKSAHGGRMAQFWGRCHWLGDDRIMRTLWKIEIFSLLLTFAGCISLTKDQLCETLYARCYTSEQGI